MAATKNVINTVTMIIVVAIYLHYQFVDGMINPDYPVKIDEFPFNVYVGFAPGYFHFCSGALISNNAVLTAAHCLINGSDTIDPSRMGVIVNAWKHDTDLLKNQYKREIKKYYMPKKYSEMAEQCSKYNAGDKKDVKLSSISRCAMYDIAILYFEKEIPLNTMKVLPLLDANMPTVDAIDAENECIVIGHGIGNPDTDANEYLQALKLTGRLEYTHLKQSDIIRSKIVDKRQTFDGDSGGPLMCRIDRKWRQIGVTSTSMEPQIATKQSSTAYIAFAAIESNRPFIDETMRNVERQMETSDRVLIVETNIRRPSDEF